MNILYFELLHVHVSHDMVGLNPAAILAIGAISIAYSC